MELLSYLQEKRKLIESYLNESLPIEEQLPKEIHQSIRYSVLNGGKRIRPIMTMMVAEILNHSYQDVLPTAAGIELIHTFSLIHDDLPCMDNDDYRRGKLTNHKVFGEAIAVLTGDALLVMGIDFICRNMNIKGVKATSVLKVLRYILDMLGTSQMLGGQVYDIQMGKHKSRESDDSDLLIQSYLKKTSALICGSLVSGAILCNAEQAIINSLEEYGKSIGLAFQITDDLLDIDAEGQDIDKVTFPGIYGVEESRKQVEILGQRAKKSLSILGEKAKLLHELTDYLMNRKY